ncbi:Gfo/Idh/MocA family protein [Micromonospora sp. KC723]|uniref:Gfo/Idh/MocA family protein n=1 Tax=Micromonospora sp. KC723 TaxID=2530381 RepID=UPI001044914B|nr:Gfo/Idh/MocA family oxidoreductase [Micromonospora sp. KC723]TDB78335.1 Gfo/Idh/MocA family oxidoreductase [Micromonospora sp. KC723]
MPLDIGLVGATRIAERAIVAPSARHGDVRLRSVAASDPDRARAFADRNGIPRVHHDYEALVADPEIDTVYVSLHNSAHHPWVVRAARAGKHVVVEKPLCLTTSQLAEIVEVASTASVQVVEAVPTEGHEWQAAVRTLITDQTYGRLRSVRTEMCFGPPAAGSYRDRPELGGGIFLDTASYWLQAVQATVGLAGAVGHGQVDASGPHGADRAFRAGLVWADGAEAELVCRIGNRHVAEHVFVFESASVRLRNFLRPVAGALPLNLVVTTADGGRTVRSFAPRAYYDTQLDRLRALLTAPAGDAAVVPAAERIALMATIHAHATFAHRAPR